MEKALKSAIPEGSVILHYTGHMFGMGCLMDDHLAIHKIIDYKQRIDNTAFIVLIPDIQWLYENGISVPNSLLHILDVYWPGNLSVILPVQDDRFQQVALNGKVAFRVPTDPMLRHMIELLGKPLITTSINRSSLQPENDLSEILKRYEKWFDLAFLPAPSKIKEEMEPSTLIQMMDTDGSGKAIPPYLKCLREGSIPFYEIKQGFTNPQILFVCTGNICRSPLAEYLFNHYAQTEHFPYVSSSAGLLDSGNIISLFSQQLLLEQGIDASQHTSRKINPEIINTSWLILTMEERQRDMLKANFPEARHKIFTLKEYTGESGDIKDPIGTDLEYYRSIYGEIDAAIRKLIYKLKQYTKS